MAFAARSQARASSSHDLSLTPVRVRPSRDTGSADSDRRYGTGPVITDLAGVRMAPVSGLMAKTQPGGPARHVLAETSVGIAAARGGGSPLPESLPTTVESSFGHDFSRIRVHADEQRRTISAAREHAPEVPSIVHDVLRSTGLPLDPATCAFMEPHFGHHFSGMHTSGHHIAQSGMAVSRPGDPYEQEADRAAEQITQMLEERTSEDVALDRRPRQEGRADCDFSRVRVHTDAPAAQAAQALNAAAFTVGQHIVFGANQYEPSTIAGRSLLAHELTHTVQHPGATFPMAQRRLIATGSQADVDSFIDLVAPAIGQDLKRDPVTNEIQTIASRILPATSPALQGILTTIMDDKVQNAEVNFGTHQAGVSVGAFPTPSDLTASRVQRIDMDDVLAIEAGAPGNGVAKLAHEITENYQAHASVPVAGLDLFPVLTNKVDGGELGRRIVGRSGRRVWRQRG